MSRVLSPDEVVRFAAMYRAGAGRSEWYAAFPHAATRPGVFNGLITRLHLHRDPHPEDVRGLPPGNPALVDGRTAFPSRVRSADAAPQLLQPGAHSAKLGSVVEKGAWRGMPIFSLTLEERATCPRSCANWDICFGNAMPWAWRHAEGPELVERLDRELGGWQRARPGGFVVRLHLLGDFYSTAYVRHWRQWLRKYPALHVFGYTAWPRDSAIGKAILRLTNDHWDRFAVRFSTVDPGPQAAITLRKMPEPGARDAIVCPVQMGKTETCASCALCWSPAARHRTIAFLAHGPRSAKGTNHGARHS